MINNTVAKAIDIMLKHEHRNIVVVDRDNYTILTVVEVLNLHGKDLETPLRDLTLSSIPVIHKDKNILDTLVFLNQKIEYICLVDDDNSLYGLLTHTDITSNIDSDTLINNYSLNDYLKLGRRMRWVDKCEETLGLLNEMIDKSFDNVIIVDDLKPIGILTTKDVVKLIKNESDLTLPVYNYMTSPVDTINENASIKEALDLINEKRYKRVIVVKADGKLSGIISQKELISLMYSNWEALMKERHFKLSEVNVMLENKNKEYESIASTDSLTGLYNRHKFSELFHASNRTNISLIILDIDFFKSVNDNFGHNVGDQVLIQLSHTLLRTLEQDDIVCRWGGEEFVVLLPNANLDSALEVAEKLRVNIEELFIDVVGHISASFGVASVKSDDKLEDIVDRADKALYLAKDSGRNCVKSEKEIKNI